MRNLLPLVFFGFMGVFMGTAAIANEDPSLDEVQAFHTLVQTGGISSVQNALQKNPTLATATDQYEFQAIHFLDYIDFQKILSLLIDYGADINAQNDEGHSVLHMLIDSEFLPLVLSAGADLELRDNKGRTPLMLSLTEPDNFDMISALLQSGADPNARDDTGQTVLGFARSFSSDDIIDLLSASGALR